MPSSYDGSRSYLQGKRRTPLQTLIIMSLFVVPLVAFLSAIAASALAAAMVSLAPEKVATMAGVILCPKNTAAARIVIVYGGYSTSNTGSFAHYTTRDYTNVLKCYDAQGTELAGKGDSFTALWWGAWMGAAAFLGALVCFAFALLGYLRDRGAQPQSQAHAAPQGTARGSGRMDEELDGLQKLEQAERQARRRE